MAGAFPILPGVGASPHLRLGRITVGAVLEAVVLVLLLWGGEVRDRRPRTRPLESEGAGLDVDVTLLAPILTPRVANLPGKGRVG